LVDKTSLRLAWESESYRQHGNPDRLGGMGLLRPDGPPTIPGARGGDLRFLWQPQELQSFAAAMMQANAHLLSVLDGAPVVAADITTANGASAQAVDAVPRSAAETQLAKLLGEQLKLSEDISAEGEKRYQDHLQEIARASAEVEAEKQAGA
jgi:hypothetical protein